MQHIHDIRMLSVIALVLLLAGVSGRPVRDVSLFLSHESFRKLTAPDVLQCPYNVVKDGNVTTNDLEYDMNQVVAFLNKQVCGSSAAAIFFFFFFFFFFFTATTLANPTNKAFKLHKLSEYQGKVRELADGDLRIATDYHYPPEFNRMTKRDPRLTFIAMPLKTPKDMLCLELYANEVCYTIACIAMIMMMIIYASIMIDTYSHAHTNLLTHFRGYSILCCRRRHTRRFY